MRIYSTPIAHRGLHDETASENSMASFEKAIEKGFNIETDVRLLKDGKVVAFHDANVIRMTKADKKVKDLVSSDIDGENYLLPNGEHIPYFEDMLKLVDGKVDILCELKSSSIFSYKLEKSVYEMIKDKPWITVQSFNPLSVAWFRRHAKEVKRGLLATRNVKTKVLRTLCKVGMLLGGVLVSKPHFLAYDILSLPSRTVKKIIGERKIKLLTWTVKSPETLEKAVQNNVDNVIFEHIEPTPFIR